MQDFLGMLDLLSGVGPCKCFQFGLVIEFLVKRDEFAKLLVINISWDQFFDKILYLKVWLEKNLQSRDSH